MKKFNRFILLFASAGWRTSAIAPVLLFAIFNLHFAFFSYSQSPQSFNYQLIARDTSGLVLCNQTVGLQLSILKDAPGGTVVFSERHTAITNNYGLANLSIGAGVPVSGSFNSIDWGNNLHFLKLEIDPTGGTTYFNMGTTQLISVPYSLYSEKAGSVTDTSNASKWTQAGNNIYNKNSGNVGIGTNTPSGKLIVKGDSSALASEPLFEVKNSAGDPVFVVYPDSVHIFLTDGSSSKANALGGFAVSGRSSSKEKPNDYLLVTPDSTRIYTTDTIKGFGVKNIGATSTTSYMQLTPKNYFIGHEAGNSITTGRYNSFMGYQAGKSDTSGSYNVFLGYQCGLNNLGSDTWSGGSCNVFIGNQSGYSNTTGKYNSVSGYKAFYSNLNGQDNVANGYMALYTNISGHTNTAIGTQSLERNVIGNRNTATGAWALNFNTTGDNNTATGMEALYYNTEGYNNTAIGEYALLQNVTGYSNTAVGANSFFTGTTYHNSTALGANCSISASNQVRVGDGDVSSIGGTVGWTTLSDGRFKKNISSNVPGLDFILKLKPVTYNIDIDKYSEFLNIPDSMRMKEAEKIKSQMLQTGFIAQEVEEAAKQSGYDFSGVDKPKNDKDYYGLRYAEFTVPLVKAVQELNEKLEVENANLKTEILNLKSLLLNQQTDYDARLKRLEGIIGTNAE